MTLLRGLVTCFGDQLPILLCLINFLGHDSLLKGTHTVHIK